MGGQVYLHKGINFLSSKVGLGREEGQEELRKANPVLLLPVPGHMDKPEIFGRALP